MSGYFSDLDLTHANPFQRDAAAAFRALFDRLKPKGVVAGRTHSGWTDRDRMLWLVAPNEALPGFDLEVAIEESTIVVNIWRAGLHFGYGTALDKPPASPVEGSLVFVEAALQGRVVLDVTRRGPFLSSIRATAYNEDRSILNAQTEYFLIGKLLSPFVPKRFTPIVPFGA